MLAACADSDDVSPDANTGLDGSSDVIAADVDATDDGTDPSDTVVDEDGRTDGGSDTSDAADADVVPSDIPADGDTVEEVDGGETPIRGTVEITSPAAGARPDDEGTLSVRVRGELLVPQGELVIRIDGTEVGRRSVTEGDIGEGFVGIDVRSFAGTPDLSHIVAIVEYTDPDTDDAGVLRSPSVEVDLRQNTDAVNDLAAASRRPIELRASRGRIARMMLDVPVAGGSAEARAWAFVDEYVPTIWGIENPRDALRIGRTVDNLAGRDTVIFHQRIDEIPVAGGQLVIQLDGENVVDVTSWLVDDEVEAEFLVSPAAAEEVALGLIESSGSVWGHPLPIWWAPEMAVTPTDATRHRLLPPAQLAWMVRIGGEHADGYRGTSVAYIDARTGDVLNVEYGEQGCELGDTPSPIWRTYTGNNLEFDGCTSMVGGNRELLCANGTCTGTNDDMDTLNTAYEAAFAWFWTVPRRNGLDGCNPDVPLYADVIPPNEAWGAFYSRACRRIAFRDREGAANIPYGTMGHEFTHGVAHNTVNLSGLPESNALNEALADFFGRFVAPFTSGSTPIYVTPGSRGGFSHFSEFDPDASVYSNADIVGTAFDRMINGAALDGYSINPIDTDLVRDVVYTVMTARMGSNTSLSTFAVLVLAEMQFRAVVGSSGPTNEEFCSATYAFRSVGLISSIGECASPSFVDPDLDGLADSEDNCPTIPNTDQSDLDGDMIGDVCDIDVDGDGIRDEYDNCVRVANPDQADTLRRFSGGGIGPGADGVGDVCSDVDQDNVPDAFDACPLEMDSVCVDGFRFGFSTRRAYRESITSPGPGADETISTTSLGEVPWWTRYEESGEFVSPQLGSRWLDEDGDERWNGCDDDIDGDGVESSGVIDRCPCEPLTGEYNNADPDGDRLGRACDNCPEDANADQRDTDYDGQGDVSDDDDDGDGVLDVDDNCPLRFNPDQLDTDDNGVGWLCDINEQAADIVLWDSDTLTRGAAASELIGAREFEVPIPFCVEDCGSRGFGDSQVIRMRSNIRLTNPLLVDSMGAVAAYFEPIVQQRTYTIYEARLQPNAIMQSVTTDTRYAFPSATSYSAQFDGESAAADLGDRALQLTLGETVGAP